MSRSYGTLSKEYTGAKCWQICGMNPYRCNNKISCPGTPRLNGKIRNKVSDCWKKYGLMTDLLGCMR